MTNKNHRLSIFTERPHFRNPSINVLMKISVDGNFVEQRFKEALQSLKNVHPLLFSSVYIDNNGEAYYRENAVAQLDLHCVKRERQNQWLEIAEIENRKPFNFEKGPLIRFFVLYDDNDFDILAVVQHLIGDGDAIARLLRDVVMAYAGIDLPLKEQKLISSQKDFPKNATPTLPVKIFTRSLNAMWNKGERPQFNDSEYREMFSNYHQSVDIGLSYSTIYPNELNALHKVCKARGVTINQAIVTAYIMAVQEKNPHSHKKKMVVGAPINVRKYLSLPADDCLGNFATAISIKNRYDKKKDFWQNADRVRNKLQLKMKSAKASWVILNLYALMNPLLVDAMYFAAYGKCDDKSAKKAAAILSVGNPKNTGISNLGRLSFDCKIGACNIRDMVFFAPANPQSYAVLGVVTLGDTLQIGFSYDRKIVSSAIMENVSLKMLTLLRGLEAT